MTDGIFGRLLASLVSDTAKAVNTDYLASDFTPEREDSICRITVVAQSGVVMRLVPSAGTAFSLNAGAALTASAVYTFDIPLDITRSWNVQNSTGTATLSFLYIQELSLVT